MRETNKILRNKKSQSQQAAGYFLSLKLGNERRTKVQGIPPSLSNKIILTFLIILGIILVFALIDFFIHKLSSEYDVPSYYFRNKIIFGAIIGLFVYWFMKKQKLWIKSLVFSAVISILLQVRYYMEGYPQGFVFLFLGIHFVILLAVSWPAFKIAEKHM